MGILKELKFCEYDDIVINPEDESEDEVMILNASGDSEMIVLENCVNHVGYQTDHVKDSLENLVKNDLECEPMRGTRASRFLRSRPTWSPSGYDPKRTPLQSLLDRGVPHVAVDRHGVEYTRRARNWTEYLSIREMLKDVRPEEILKFGLKWINSATEWGKFLTLTNFRFMGGKWYRDVVQLVERKLKIQVKTKHPYNKIRGGRKTRKF